MCQNKILCSGAVQACIVGQAKRQEAKLSSQDGGWADSTKDFLRQMGYREYARYLSFHFPFTHERSLLEHLRAAPWNFDQRLFKARPAWTPSSVCCCPYIPAHKHALV